MNPWAAREGKVKYTCFVNCPFTRSLQVRRVAPGNKDRACVEHLRCGEDCFPSFGVFCQFFGFFFFSSDWRNLSLPATGRSYALGSPGVCSGCLQTTGCHYHLSRLNLAFYPPPPLWDLLCAQTHGWVPLVDHSRRRSRCTVRRNGQTPSRGSPSLTCPNA